MDTKPPDTVTIAQTADVETVHMQIRPRLFWQRLHRLLVTAKALSEADGVLQVALMALLYGCFFVILFFISAPSAADVSALLAEGVIVTLFHIAEQLMGVLVLSLMFILPMVVASNVLSPHVERIVKRFFAWAVMPHTITITIDHLALKRRQHRVRWGEIDAFVLEAEEVYIVTDTGSKMGMGLAGLLDDVQLAWLTAHLQHCLERFAPGSPDDVPGALRELRTTSGEAAQPHPAIRATDATVR